MFKHKNLMVMMKICCAAVLALGLAACGSKTVAPVVIPATPPAVAEVPDPSIEAMKLSDAKAAAMTAATDARTAAVDAQEAADTVADLTGDGSDQAMAAQDAADAADEAATAAEAASELAQAATMSADAEGEQTTAETEQGNADAQLEIAQEFEREAVAEVPDPSIEAMKLSDAKTAAMTAATDARTAAVDAQEAADTVADLTGNESAQAMAAQDAADAADEAATAAEAASELAQAATMSADAEGEQTTAETEQGNADAQLEIAQELVRESQSEGAMMGNSGGTTAPITTQVDAVVAAALNEPRAGSVTQSSDGGDNNVTRDLVKVTITRSGSNLNVDASYNGQTVVSTADAAEASGVEDVVGLPKGTRLYERVVEAGAEYGIEFYRSLAAGDVREHDGTAVPAGQLWVDVYTDYETAGDTDYLSLGIWVYVPDGATNLDSYEYGAFADGNDPFSQNNLVSLTGTASYVGEATGVYAVKADARNYFFDAAATLTANFGAGSTLGTIEGRVHDFEVDGQPIAGNPQLMLGTANIGNSNGGFFKGDTSATFAGDTFAGKWGGQFYSNGESDGKPGSVAGTFGAGTADRSKGFLGAFGAHKQ